MKRKTKNTTEFIPKNPVKYSGRYPIIIRSSWERFFCQFCDITDTVLSWSSENISIPYYDPVRKRFRRYYPDFWIKMVNKDGKINRYIIEIKPDRETRPPLKRGRKTKKTLRTQQLTYLTNKAKWGAATQYCRKMKLEFKILTERNLFTEYGKKNI